MGYPQSCRVRGLESTSPAQAWMSRVPPRGHTVSPSGLALWRPPQGDIHWLYHSPHPCGSPCKRVAIRLQEPVPMVTAGPGKNVTLTPNQSRGNNPRAPTDPELGSPAPPGWRRLVDVAIMLEWCVHRGVSWGPSRGPDARLGDLGDALLETE